MRALSGFPIAFTIRSVDHSLSAQLIPRWGLLEAGAHGISIALPIQSFDCTLQMYFQICPHSSIAA